MPPTSRRELADRPQRVRAVVALSHHLNALLFEQVAEPRAKQVVIVDEDDAWGDGFWSVRWVAQHGLPGHLTGPLQCTRGL